MQFSIFDKVVTLVLLILLSVYGILIIIDFFDLYYMNQRILNGGFFLGFIAIIHVASFGTFLKNSWSLIMVTFLILVFAVSGLFKIMHWPYPTYLTILSSFGIFGIYAIHFYKKKQKKKLDFLKLLWVLLMCLNSILIDIEIHFFEPYLRNLVWLVFNITYFTFAYQVLNHENTPRT